MKNQAGIRTAVPIEVRNIGEPKRNNQSDDDHNGSHLLSPRVAANNKRHADTCQSRLIYNGLISFPSASKQTNPKNSFPWHRLKIEANTPQLADEYKRAPKPGRSQSAGIRVSRPMLTWETGIERRSELSHQDVGCR
jgi:hypothetical protein